MDHQQSKKRKSVAMEGDGSDPEVTTPVGTPAAKRMKISQPQKQALIDNLQLEITERARHLRAHYALQATDLRSRIERRINRIPVSLRKANMGELLEKYTEAAPVSKKMAQAVDSSKALPNVPAAERNRPPPSVAGANPFSVIEQKSEACPTPQRGPKRRSSQIDILSDKENEPAVQPDQLSNPKNSKRAKTATSGITRAATRTTKTHPSNILSPKSHNSRTLPRSPIKDPTTPSHSPSKPSYLARPISPLKPVSPLKTAATAATSAISASLHGMVEHAKRGAGTAAAGLRRTESKGRAAANNARGKIMAPPARPAAPQQKQHPHQHERPASQISNHSAASTSSMTSSATTVITKKAVRKGKTGLSASTTTTRKLTCPTTTKVNAMKGAAGGGKATGAAAAKKSAAAEPAAGRRVLRRRN